MTTAAEARAPGAARPMRVQVLANLAGSTGSAVLQLAFVPLYVRLLGIEAYGLIGFYLSLQALAMMVDLGVSTTVNRELARLTAQPERAGSARDLLRTLEAWYWGVGVILGAAVVWAAPFIARDWIQPGSLPTSVIEQALRLMGGLVALQWPISLYQGGLLGLQRQLRLNAIRLFFALLITGGSAVVLWRISATIAAFLAWQMAAGALQIGVLAWSLWSALPRGDLRPRFDLARLREIWRFAAGAGAILFSGLLLSQLDKIVLSRLLPLAPFGYYALASAVGNGLYVLINPVFGAVFPRFSALCAAGDREALSKEYRQGLQAMAVLVLPAALTLSFFATEAVVLWTGDPQLAQRVGPLARLLLLGTAINGLVHLPYALQLAHGWTSIGVRINLFLLAFMTLALLGSVPRYGGVGAAATWLAVNAAYMGAAVPWTHRRLLPPGSLRWWAHDVGPSVAVSLLVGGTARALWTAPVARTQAAALLALVGLMALGGSVVATAGIRRRLRDWMERRQAATAPVLRR